MNLKRMLLVGLVLAFGLSSGAFAADKVLGFWFDTDTGPIAGSKTLDLGSVNSWIISYTGSATVSPTRSVATINGGFAGNKIWKYEYSTDNQNWSTIDSLVGSFSAMPNTMGNSITENSAPVILTAQYLKLGYNVSLTSTSDASASGSGAITATAVPEPSSILGLSTLLAPLGFLIRRKYA